MTAAESTRFLYLDTSGLVKLVIVEAESLALRAFLAAWPLRVSSALASIELIRATRRAAAGGVEADARRLLAHVDRLALTDQVVQAAGTLPPPVLQSLDAVHLASALSLGSSLGGMVTYDDRLAEAARLAGVTVYSPR